MAIRHGRGRRGLAALAVAALGLLGSGCVASTPCGGGPFRTPTVTEPPPGSAACDRRTTRTGTTGTTAPTSARPAPWLGVASSTDDAP